jgi:hypothetical protein
MKKLERNQQELCHYLAGHRDGLRRQIKNLSKDLAKVEAELQAAAVAAELERARGVDENRPTK